MIAAATLADVVIEPGDVEQLHLRQVAHAVTGDRELGLACPKVQAAHVPDHHHRVGIHRVDMKQVVLHLTHDPSELGNVATENAVAAHAGEL